MADRPEYLPTKKALDIIVENCDCDPWKVAEETSILTARTVAEHLQSIGSERHPSAFGDTIWAIPINEWERFIAKGESE